MNLSDALILYGFSLAILTGILAVTFVSVKHHILKSGKRLWLLKHRRVSND